MSIRPPQSPTTYKKRLSRSREFPTLRDVRREAAKLYWATKSAQMDPQLSSRLGYILQVIASILKSEAECDVEKIRADVETLKAEIDAARGGGALNAVDRGPSLRLPTPRRDGSIN